MTLTDSALVAALAEYARSALARDAEALLSVADRFALMGANGLAAEAVGSLGRHSCGGQLDTGGKVPGIDQCLATATYRGVRIGD